MVLSFSTKIDGKPSFFVEKIIKKMIVERELADILLSKSSYSIDDDAILKCYPKIHTIRTDKKDRWKVGNKIHFVINNRTKNRLQFAPVIPVKFIQEIEITYWMGCGDYPAVTIDGQSLKNREVEILAQNDGFDSVEDFFKYFDSDFTGKIIHWTDYSYCG